MTVPVLSPTARAEQATFRTLLDCMARPGKVAALHELRQDDGPWATALAVLQCLLDHEVTFAALTDDPLPRERLLRRTCSRPVAPEVAGFVLAGAASALTAVQRANEGTPEYPHESATLVLSIDSVGEGPLTLRLIGPGVNGAARLALGGVDQDVFLALEDRNAGLPLGIDVILAGRNGLVACLPRSTRIEVG